MKLNNHIVNRLTKDPSLWVEMCDTHRERDIAAGKQNTDPETYDHLFSMLNNKGNKTYYITRTVIDRLDLFDTKKCLDVEGWRIFSGLPDFKKTFILGDGLPGSNRCIRVVKENGLLYFCHLEFRMHPKSERSSDIEGNLYWILLFVDLDNNKIAEHWSSEDGKKIAPFLYALMCFVELCDNQIVVIQPSQKWGTQKQGKIINSLKEPITIVSNTWNVTTIRTEGFPVSGHAAIRWTGAGRTIPKLVFIEPFMKHGYTRRSGKELSGEPPMQHI